MPVRVAGDPAAVVPGDETCATATVVRRCAPPGCVAAPVGVDGADGDAPFGVVETAGESDRT